MNSTGHSTGVLKLPPSISLLSRRSAWLARPATVLWTPAEPATDPGSFPGRSACLAPLSRRLVRVIGDGPICRVPRGVCDMDGRRPGVISRDDSVSLALHRPVSPVVRCPALVLRRGAAGRHRCLSHHVWPPGLVSPVGAESGGRLARLFPVCRDTRLVPCCH